MSARMERLVVAIYILVIFAIAALMVLGIVRAIGGGSVCELYRYTPIAKVPAFCLAEVVR